MSKLTIFNSSDLKDIEFLIRNGKVKQAKESISQIIHNRNFSASDKDLEKIANLCRRAQHSSLAIKILSPTMKAYREGKKVRPPLRLVAEYAIALHRIGNSTEAKLLLNDRSALSDSYSQFYLGLIFLSEWEYVKAKNCFIEYLKNKNLDSYEQSLGELNLLAANIFLQPNEDSHEVEILALIARLEKFGFTLLANNAKEVLIQYYASFEENDINWSKKNSQTKERFRKILLNENKLIFELQSTRYSLYLQKWLCVNLIKKNSKKALEDFYALKEKARSFSSWEILRDCEFYIAKIRDSSELFNKLYYGTPYIGYRQYIQKRYQEFKPESSFLWASNQNSYKKFQIIDLSDFSYNNSLESLGKAAGVSHRTLLSLTSDLFKPLSVGSLFSKIYPGEYYDQQSSGLRVRQCIFRLKNELDKRNLGLKIDFNNGYSIEPINSLALRFSIDLKDQSDEIIDKEDLLLNQINKLFMNNQFTATQLADSMGKSHSSAVRLLNSIKNSGSLICIGDGAKRKYLIKKNG